jgi:hypothetical protein
MNSALTVKKYHMHALDVWLDLPCFLQEWWGWAFPLRGLLFGFGVIWVGWAHKATVAPQPFSDILFVPKWFISPVVSYLWQSTGSYIMESHHSHLVPWKCLLKWWNMNSAKATHSHEGCVGLFLLPYGTLHKKVWQLKNQYYRASFDGFCPFFFRRFLVVPINPTRTEEFYTYHLQSPMWVEGIHMTGASRCPEGIVCDTAVTTSVPCSLRHNASQLGFSGPEPCFSS